MFLSAHAGEVLLLLNTFGIVIAGAIQLLNTRKTYQLQVLAIASKLVSEGNAEAIEHTRLQNVRLASAIKATHDQNDDLAVSINHVHVCVEAKLAEVKDAIPDVIKETVPAVIKDVVPDAIKEALPDAIKTSSTLIT